MGAFVPWYALQDAKLAPESPGVFQIRVVDGLIDYPTGKSAMVHYGYADNLHRTISEFSGRGDLSDYLCRHKSCDEPWERLQVILQRFKQRFGSLPTWPVSRDAEGR